ncbi:MAG: hypothetical protein U5N58_10670 [Actinomycetota bacterium]|nr:hypothetical protein [Actinomycetota bacterium]
MVFGSATPSVVIRHKAETESDFELLKMPGKAHQVQGHTEGGY